ncbi:MAG: hypothetical protein JXR11_02580 [Balneola sp.]
MKTLNIALLVIIMAFSVITREFEIDPDYALPFMERQLPTLLLFLALCLSFILSRYAQKIFPDFVLLFNHRNAAQELEKKESFHASMLKVRDETLHKGREEAEEKAKEAHEFSKTRISILKALVKLFSGAIKKLQDRSQNAEDSIPKDLQLSFEEGREFFAEHESRGQYSRKSPKRYEFSNGKASMLVILAFLGTGLFAQNSLARSASNPASEVIHVVEIPAVQSVTCPESGLLHSIEILVDKSGSVDLNAQALSPLGLKDKISKYLGISRQYRECGFSIKVSVIDTDRITRPKKFEVEQGPPHGKASHAKRRVQILRELDRFETYLEELYALPDGGGTSYYRNVLAASERLQKTDASNKWMIILSDNEDTSGFANFSEYVGNPQKFRDNYPKIASKFLAYEELKMNGIKVSMLFDLNSEASYQISRFWEWFYLEQEALSADLSADL